MIDQVEASAPAVAAEQRAIESALRETEERFRAVWEATSEAMALSDPDGTVVAVNPAYCALYGLTPAQVVGQSFAIIFPEEMRAAAVEQYHAVFADLIRHQATKRVSSTRTVASDSSSQGQISFPRRGAGSDDLRDPRHH